MPGASLRVDLHCHTRRSFDSLSPPEAVLRVAAERGIDRIAITDQTRSPRRSGSAISHQTASWSERR